MILPYLLTVGFPQLSSKWVSTESKLMIKLNLRFMKWWKYKIFSNPILIFDQTASIFPIITNLTDFAFCCGFTKKIAPLIFTSFILALTSGIILTFIDVFTVFAINKLIQKLLNKIYIWEKILKSAHQIFTSYPL